MGELLTVAMSRGKCHWEKIRAVSASASGCSSLACQRKRQRGTQSLRPPPHLLIPLRLPHTGSSVGTHGGHRGPPGLGTVVGQYFQFAMALQTALTESNMAWTSGIMIIFYLSFFCFLFISMSQWKKGKPCQFLVPWHSCFSELGFFLFVSMVIVLMLFYSSKEKAQNFNSKGKNSNNVN